MKRRILFIVIIVLQSFGVTYSQETDVNLVDTVYYDAKWNRIKSPESAFYYRPPVVKDGVKYKVEYYKIDNIIFYSGWVRPVKIGKSYSIELNNAIKDGYCVFYWPYGYKKSEGFFVNNKKVGEWKYYYEIGNIKTIENYYENQPTLYVTNYFFNGDKLTEGLKVLVAYNGDTSYKNHGQWICYYYGKNRISMIQHYTFGNTNGLIVYYDSMGNKTAEGSLNYLPQSIDLQNRARTLGRNVKNGKWVYYDVSNNQIQSVQKYINGLLDSTFVVYHTPTGKVKGKGYYNNGVRTGSWIIYFNGSDRILSETVYKNGKGHNVFYDSIKNKTIIFEGNDDMGKRVGKWTRYYPENGRIKSTEKYTDNFLNGLITHYDSSGNILSELSYKNGVAEGSFTYYHYGTKEKWLVMQMAADSFTGYINTYYPSGEVKRKTKKSGHELLQICYDKTGGIIDCEPIRTEATFNGDIMTYIGDNLEYPVEAKQNKLQGKVKIGFVIDEYGKVRDPFVVEGFDASCDEEALRLVSQMPLWIPETLEGIPVQSYKTLPVVFWLPSEVAGEGM